MGIGIGLILLAAGAILTWGVTDTASGVNVAAVGVILMIVGFISLLMTLAFWSSFSPFAANAPFARRTAASAGYETTDHVVIDRQAAPRRTVVVREDPDTIVTTTTRERVVRHPEDVL